jgi:hypothetical protein
MSNYNSIIKLKSVQPVKDLFQPQLQGKLGIHEKAEVKCING